MEKKLKAKWVKALRSGKFQQGTQRLKQPGADGKSAYCCLGVLRHIINPKSTAECRAVGDTLCKEHLRVSCLEDDAQHLLARMNDGKNEFVGQPQTFKQIADYIEANL